MSQANRSRNNMGGLPGNDMFVLCSYCVQYVFKTCSLYSSDLFLGNGFWFRSDDNLYFFDNFQVWKVSTQNFFSNMIYETVRNESLFWGCNILTLWKGNYGIASMMLFMNKHFLWRWTIAVCIRRPMFSQRCPNVLPQFSFKSHSKELLHSSNVGETLFVLGEYR